MRGVMLASGIVVALGLGGCTTVPPRAADRAEDECRV